jgi:hypothetical protein
MSTNPKMGIAKQSWNVPCNQQDMELIALPFPFHFTRAAIKPSAAPGLDFICNRTPFGARHSRLCVNGCHGL